MQPVPGPNLADPAFRSNPFPYYKRLRWKSPVHPVVLPDRQQAWLLTRYRDVVSVLNDERFGTSPPVARPPGLPDAGLRMPALLRPLSRGTLSLDPEHHARLGSLIQTAIPPRFVESLRRRVQAVADGLLAEARRRRGPSMDLIGDYALPLPTIVIGEMIGVPPAERKKFVRWSNDIVAADWSGWSGIRAIPRAMAFMRLIRKLTARKRFQPADDLLSALITAGESGDRLSDDQLLALVFLILLAGHETTVNLIGNGTLALLEHPGELQRLRDRPELIGLAVEELLRYGSPLETARERYAREDIQIHGKTIPAGSLVFAVLASANRDEAIFTRPDRLDLSRDPNPHVAFGSGIHFWLGAALARLVGQVAILALLREFTDLRLASRASSLCWRKGLGVRGLVALPVRVSHRTRSMEDELAG